MEEAWRGAYVLSPLLGGALGRLAAHELALLLHRHVWGGARPVPLLPLLARPLLRSEAGRLHSKEHGFVQCRTTLTKARFRRSSAHQAVMETRKVRIMTSVLLQRHGEGI